MKIKNNPCEKHLDVEINGGFCPVCMQMEMEGWKAAFRGAMQRIISLEDFHPRAMKLMDKKKNFIVIADDEPYFIRAYGMIRKREIEQGIWTEEDEHLFR